MCLIWRLFEAGRTTGLMPRRNRLTASPGSPHCGRGLRRDGEIVVVVSELLRAAEQQGRPRAHRRTVLNRNPDGGAPVRGTSVELGEPFMNGRLQAETLRRSECS